MCCVLIMTKWRDPYASDASEQIKSLASLDNHNIYHNTMHWT